MVFLVERLACTSGPGSEPSVATMISDIWYLQLPSRDMTVKNNIAT